jgi:hypothetical protein
MLDTRCDTSFRRLEITSGKLKEMQVRRAFKLAYRSVSQDIAECNTAVNNFLLDYAVILAFVQLPSHFLTV